MIRKLSELLLAIAVTLMLTSCGAMSSAISSAFTQCPAAIYSLVAWSPDGRHIAYQVNVSSHSSQIYVMNPSGSGVKRLASEVIQSNELQWFPDSQTVATYDTGHIFSLALDGSTSTLSFPTNSLFRVRLSPDGESIAYNYLVPAERTVSGIGVMRRDGSKNTRLTRDFDLLGGWSPDGSWIAYLHLVDVDKAFVSIMRADGSDQRQLVEGIGPVDWSPDGQWLRYFSSTDELPHIVRADGTDTKLIGPTTDGRGYDWLPDSQHLAFIASVDQHLTVIDINTLKKEEISTGFTLMSSWSPDSTQVVFIGLEQLANSPYSVTDIYVINRDGTNLKRLTDNPGRYQCFHWPF